MQFISDKMQKRLYNYYERNIMETKVLLSEKFSQTLSYALAFQRFAEKCKFFFPQKRIYFIPLY